MDFLLQIYGPYGPYMNVLIRNMVHKVQICTFGKKIYRRCPNSEFCRRIQNFKMAISTISMRPNPKIPIQFPCVQVQIQQSMRAGSYFSESHHPLSCQRLLWNWQPTPAQGRPISSSLGDVGPGHQRQSALPLAHFGKLV